MHYVWVPAAAAAPTSHDVLAQRGFRNLSQIPAADFGVRTRRRRRLRRRRRRRILFTREISSVYLLSSLFLDLKSHRPLSDALHSLPLDDVTQTFSSKLYSWADFTNKQTRAIISRRAILEKMALSAKSKKSGKFKLQIVV